MALSLSIRLGLASNSGANWPTAPAAVDTLAARF